MTTLLIVSGGGVFTFSHLISLRSFGAAVAGVALFALVCDLIFVPALLKFFVGRRDWD